MRRFLRRRDLSLETADARNVETGNVRRLKTVRVSGAVIGLVTRGSGSARLGRVI
jgi:hypothetical protein